MRVNGAKLGGTWKDENTPKLNSYTAKRSDCPSIPTNHPWDIYGIFTNMNG